MLTIKKLAPALVSLSIITASFSAMAHKGGLDANKCHVKKEKTGKEWCHCHRNKKIEECSAADLTHQKDKHSKKNKVKKK